VAVYSVDKLMAETRRLAAEYRRMTGQPLAVSGEIAKYDAARLLDLEVCNEPGLGYDAIGRSGERAGRRVQIKGRAIFDTGKGGQRVGQLKLEQPWDSVMLVLMDEEFMTSEIWEAEREPILAAVEEVEDSKRSKRGPMSVARFKAIGQLVWAREEGEIHDGIWENY